MYPTFTRGIPQQKPNDAFIQQFIDDISDVIVAILERRFNEAIVAASSSSNPNIATNAWLTTLGLPTMTWYAGQAVAEGAIVLDSNSPLAAQICTTAGTTGTTIPAFSAVFGATTTDNTVVWTNIGQTRQLRVLERGNRYGAASQLGAILASFGVASAAKLAEEYTKADWIPFCSELNAESKSGKPKVYGAFDFLFDPKSNVQTPRPQLIAIAGADQPVGATPDTEGISAVFGKFGIDMGRQPPNSFGWRNMEFGIIFACMLFFLGSYWR